MSRFHAIACMFAASLLAQHASAQINLVKSRDALKSNASVEWFAFGGDGAFISTPVTENFGIEQVTVSSSSGELLVKREGTSWQGDFIPGQYLLTEPFVSDSFLISFSPPVTGLGMQIDPGSSNPPFKGSFTARLCFYDVNDKFLGSVQSQAQAGTGENNTAKFLGARSAGAPISLVRVQVAGVTPGFSVEGDLAINRMDLVTPLTQAPAAPARKLPASLPACPA